MAPTPRPLRLVPDSPPLSPSDALVAELDDLLPSWNREIRSLANQTQTTYLAGAAAFRRWLSDPTIPDDPAPIELPDELNGLSRKHLVAYKNWLAGQPWAESTVNNRWRGTQQLLKWMTETEEVWPASPMLGIAPPKVHDKHVPTVPSEILNALLGTCKDNKDWLDVRDKAVLALYIDSGARLSEVAILRVDNLDLKHDVAYSTGKGGKPRTLSFGTKTGGYLERYLRLRRKHKAADGPELWLPLKGRQPVSSHGMHLMLKRRCKLAGIDPLHMHLLRHTFATEYLDGGGDESELMRLGGWDSRQMVARYTNTTATRRAVVAHKKHSLVDKL